jgi:hypothetical protein
MKSIVMGDNGHVSPQSRRLVTFGRFSGTYTVI